MQAGVSASRQQLGEDWQQALPDRADLALLARRRHLRHDRAGAFMPSLDGIGRYYPLTLFACADAGAAIPPPDIDAQDEWFAAAEDFLLSTLDKDVAYETITGGARSARAAAASMPARRACRTA